MQRTSLSWWGSNSKEGTLMTSLSWTRYPFNIPTTKQDAQSNRSEDNSGKIFNNWNQVCHTCGNCQSKQQNVGTIPNLQRCATWTNHNTWICDVSCRMKVCLSVKGLDGWGKDEEIDWCPLAAMEGPSHCKQSFNSTAHSHTWCIRCISHGFGREPNPVNGDWGRSHPSKLHLFVTPYWHRD